jgi:Predicted ATP-dependent serine protease
LASEVRSISQAALRINEAQKLGFKRCVLPKNNLKDRSVTAGAKIEIIGVDSVKEALSLI